jgi:hypothetical protein
LRYKEIETSLAEIMRVESKDMGAFRGRLRHLRNIGLPRLPKSGSGRAIDYTPRHALEMLLALRLENAGQTPANAALVAASMVRQSPYGQHKGEDAYVCMTEGQAKYTMTIGRRAFLKFMDRAPDIFLVINISGCVRTLECALSRSILER